MIKKTWVASLALLVAAPLPAVTIPPGRATLELHAHLFMKEGMSWMFSGDFDGPLAATDWKDRFKSMANPDSLERSEIGLVVATLYAHPLLTMSLRESVRRQIRTAEKFVASHPDWIIAKHPWEAREALRKGKRSIVFALEGASGIIESEEDLREFVDQDGIRIINLLHLTDDEFGGAAFLGGFKTIASPWAWFTQLFSPHYDSDGVRVNNNGLTEAGRKMAQAMLRHRVWIDLAHASDRAQDDLEPLLEADHQPRLFTHTMHRRFGRVERAITHTQLERVKRSGGIVGVIPSDDMLAGTETAPGLCPKGCTECKGGFWALATQYAGFAKDLSPEQVALGSDYNGGLHHLPPTCGTGTPMDTQGLWNIGQQATVWDALEKVGLPVPRDRSRMIERFLSAWDRVDPQPERVERTAAR